MHENKAFHSKSSTGQVVKNEQMSRVMRNACLHMQKKNGAEQLPGDRAADQPLCFRNKGGTIPPLIKSKVSSLLMYSPLCVRPGRKLRRQVLS